MRAAGAAIVVSLALSGLPVAAQEAAAVPGGAVAVEMRLPRSLSDK